MNEGDSQGMTGLNLAPGSDFPELQPMVAAQLERIASGLRPAHFAGLLDPFMRQALAQGFAEAGADEGTLWLVDQRGENLVPAYNTGPRSSEVVGRFEQPLGAGLVCMVFASEQPFLENEVWKNSNQSKLLDQKLEVQTCAMIAVPFYFLHACRGVISCVQLRRGAGEPAPPGFRPGHLESVQRAGSVLTQLLDYRLLSRAVGWTRD